MPRPWIATERRVKRNFNPVVRLSPFPERCLSLPRWIRIANAGLRGPGRRL